MRRSKLGWVPHLVIGEIATDPSRIRLLSPATVVADTDRLTDAVHKTKRSIDVSGHSFTCRQARAMPCSSARESAVRTSSQILRDHRMEIDDENAYRGQASTSAFHRARDVESGRVDRSLNGGRSFARFSTTSVSAPATQTGRRWPGVSGSSGQISKSP
jgi:hypothetical protein